MNEQPDLPIVSTPMPTDEEVLRLMGFLRGRSWLTDDDLLELHGLPVTEGNKRWIRKLAEQSKGHIIGHSKGYRLTAELTHEDYKHWDAALEKRNQTLRERREHTREIFYATHPNQTQN